MVRLGLALVTNQSSRSSQLLTRLECAYISNYVALNSRRPNMPWSIRKTAIYHCHDTQLQCSTWVMVAPSESAKSCLDQYISTYSPDISSNPFEIHVILLDDAIVSWRPYINYIAESCKKMVYHKAVIFFALC